MLRRSSGGAPVLCWHTQQDTAIAVRHEVDRLGAAGSASNESRSLDHLLLMHTLVGAQWRRRTNECSRTGRGPCASRPPSSREHAGGSWPCSRHGLGCGSRRDGPASLHSRSAKLWSVPCVLFFNRRKSPRHNALGVCMYGVSSRPALAGGVCMYVLNRPERRGRPADSAMMADAAGRPPPGLGPRRSGFRHVGGRSSFGPFSPVAYSC